VTITIRTVRRFHGIGQVQLASKARVRAPPFCRRRAAENAAQQARKAGMVEIEVKVKGSRRGLEQAMNLQNAG